MKIIVCIKEVPDPDGVNAFALAGRLQIDVETHQVTQAGIPLVMNGYDAQAIEAALRLRDKGLRCTISTLNIGARDPGQLFRYAFSLGADDGYYIDEPGLRGAHGDAFSLALARAIEHLGAIDLVLCGRQSSDDDQGIVGPGIAALLGLPCVTIASGLQQVSDQVMRINRVLHDGEEVVEVDLPAVVTVSNEVGEPRYPSVRDMMAARRKSFITLTATDRGLTPSDVERVNSRVRRAETVPVRAQGRCEVITGRDVKELAADLAGRLRAEGLI